MSIVINNIMQYYVIVEDLINLYLEILNKNLIGHFAKYFSVFLLHGTPNFFCYSSKRKRVLLKVSNTELNFKSTKKFIFKKFYSIHFHYIYFLLVKIDSCMFFTFMLCLLALWILKPFIRHHILQF